MNSHRNKIKDSEAKNSEMEEKIVKKRQRSSIATDLENNVTKNKRLKKIILNSNSSSDNDHDSEEHKSNGHSSSSSSSENGEKRERIIIQIKNKKHNKKKDKLIIQLKNNPNNSENDKKKSNSDEAKKESSSNSHGESGKIHINLKTGNIMENKKSGHGHGSKKTDSNTNTSPVKEKEKTHANTTINDKEKNIKSKKGEKEVKNDNKKVATEKESKNEGKRTEKNTKNETKKVEKDTKNVKSTTKKVEVEVKSENIKVEKDNTKNENKKEIDLKNENIKGKKVVEKNENKKVTTKNEMNKNSEKESKNENKKVEKIVKNDHNKKMEKEDIDGKNESKRGKKSDRNANKKTMELNNTKEESTNKNDSLSNDQEIDNTVEDEKSTINEKENSKNKEITNTNTKTNKKIKIEDESNNNNNNNNTTNKNNMNKKEKPKTGLLSKKENELNSDNESKAESNGTKTTKNDETNNSNAHMSGAEVETEETKKRRGRPKKKEKHLHPHPQPHTHSHTTKYIHKVSQNEEPEDQLDIDEIDPKGEEKIDKDGILKGGRIYNVRTFILPNRSKTRLYMYTLDIAKQLGFRDSNLFLSKYTNIKRYWTSEEDNNYLYNMGLMQPQTRTRGCGIVTARNAFCHIGHEIIFNGQPGRDDYFSDGKEEGGYTDREESKINDTTTHDNTNSKIYEINSHHENDYNNSATDMDIDALKDDTASVRSQTPMRIDYPINHPSSSISSSQTFLNNHYTQSSTVYSTPQNQQGYRYIFSKHTNPAKYYFKQALLQSVAEYNIVIQTKRKNTFFDIHTNIEQVAQNTQPSQMEIEMKVEPDTPISSSTTNKTPSLTTTTTTTTNEPLIPSSSNNHDLNPDSIIHFMSDKYLLNYQAKKIQQQQLEEEKKWKKVDEDQDSLRYPISLMDGQYQGLHSLYPRFTPNDEIQRLQDKCLELHTTNLNKDTEVNESSISMNIESSNHTRYALSPSPSIRSKHYSRSRSHQGSINDTSSSVSTPNLKHNSLEDRRKRRGRPRKGRRVKSKKESMEVGGRETPFEDEINNTSESQDHGYYINEKNNTNEEDELIDVVNVNPDGKGSSTSSFVPTKAGEDSEENICVHCNSIDPPEQLTQQMDPSVFPKNLLIKCSVCHRSQHPCCVDIYDPYMITKIKSYPWQCNDCKLCLTCNEAGDESKLLFCDICDRGYHTYCIVPKLEKLPKGHWVCHQCAVCASCHSTKPNTDKGSNTIHTRRSANQLSTDWRHAVTNIKDEKNTTSREVYLATFCNTCFEHFSSGRFCPICFHCYKEHESDISMICCDNCDRWIDVDCDPDLDDEKYHTLCEQSDAKYLCPFCDKDKMKKLKAKMNSDQRIVIYKNYGIIVPPFNNH